MQQLKAEIVVVGGGGAGLAAAVAAAESGARVIVFEKTAFTGGASKMAMGPFAVESRLQHLKQIGITKEEVFKIHMEHAHWRVDARLVKVFIDKIISK